MDIKRGRTVDYEDMLRYFSKISGRKYLHGYVIGVLRAIMEERGAAPEEKTNDVTQVLKALRQVWNDQTLPWDTTDPETASTVIEAETVSTAIEVGAAPTTIEAETAPTAIEV